MGRYLMRLGATLIPSFVLILSAVFLLARLIPGDPAIAILGDNADAARLAELRHQLGLDRPLFAQYTAFLADAVRGDLGNSLMTGRPALSEALSVFPHTLLLTGFGIAVAVILGIPLGTMAAIRRGGMADAGIMTAALVGVSTPPFLSALLLILLLSVHLRIFPAIGVGVAGDVGSILLHVALPALALGSATAALVARMTRASMLEVLSQDFVRTAHAKGLSRFRVVYVHALRNALIQVTTVVGAEVGRLMGGSVVLETMFSRAGMGKLLVDAIYQRDYPQVQAAIIVFLSAVVIVNTLVDVVYAWADPRVRYQ